MTQECYMCPPLLKTRVSLCNPDWPRASWLCEWAVLIRSEYFLSNISLVILLKPIRWFFLRGGGWERLSISFPTSPHQHFWLSRTFCVLTFSAVVVLCVVPPIFSIFSFLFNRYKCIDFLWCLVCW